MLIVYPQGDSRQKPGTEIMEEPYWLTCFTFFSYLFKINTDLPTQGWHCHQFTIEKSPMNISQPILCRQHLHWGSIFLSDIEPIVWVDSWPVAMTSRNNKYFAYGFKGFGPWSLDFIVLNPYVVNRILRWLEHGIEVGRFWWSRNRDREMLQNWSGLQVPERMCGVSRGSR